ATQPIPCEERDGLRVQTIVVPVVTVRRLPQRAPEVVREGGRSYLVQCGLDASPLTPVEARECAPPDDHLGAREDAEAGAAQFDTRGFADGHTAMLGRGA